MHDSESLIRKCNVLDWDSQVSLFKAAITQWGAVDIVVRFHHILQPFSLLVPLRSFTVNRESFLLRFRVQGLPPSLLSHSRGLWKSSMVTQSLQI